MRPTDAALIEAARRRGWPWPSNVLVFVSRRENRHAAQKYFREAREIDMEDLIKRIEAAEGLDRELDAEICGAAGWGVVRDKRDLQNYYEPTKGHSWQPIPRYTSSIDAAMTLVGECDELKIMRGKKNSSAVIYKDSESFDGYAATPALALCAAALRARIEKPLA